MTKRRGKAEILQDIILTMRNREHQPTRIMSANNISYTSLKEYIKILIDKGIVMQIESKRKSKSHPTYDYELTDRGMKLASRIRDFDDIRSLLE